MICDEVKEKYAAVGGVLDAATKQAESVEVVGEEENAELSAIQLKLKEINDEFKKEISKLENSSEWDKLCIAFFGETNAGKSTVIEALRIIYDEEQRRLEKESQEKEYESVLSDHCKDYGKLLGTLQKMNTLLNEKKTSAKFLLTIKKVGLAYYWCGN